MLCPVCKTEMLTLEYRLIELDHCPGCGGVWLDSGELQLVAERLGAIKPDLLAALEKGEHVRSEAAPKRLCPVCAKRMRGVNSPELPGIIVDRCARRHGLWFNRGELEAVVRAAGAQPGNELVRFLSELEVGARKGARSGSSGA